MVDLRRGDVVVINARTSRRTADGYLRTAYSPDEIDVIAVYCAELDCCFAIPIGQIGSGGSFNLRLAPPKNGQRAGLHFAEEYPLGAIAQLEERLRGTQEVAGSSPASSTPPADVAATIVGAHEFRNRFGWYMERAAAGEEIVVTRRCKPHLRLSAVAPALDLAA